MGINRHPQISSDEDSDEDISDTDLAFLERGGLRQSIDTSSLGKDESLGSYVFE